MNLSELKTIAEKKHHAAYGQRHTTSAGAVCWMKRVDMAHDVLSKDSGNEGLASAVSELILGASADMAAASVAEMNYVDAGGDPSYFQLECKCCA